ncbi:hypothetical protein K474DRAFT_1590434 [Panus rudis PR-1116 ss-1]|nr:hypothetical protein K474DRAFT_1590434 [Panus rudis PR-1116 ss-1]
MQSQTGLPTNATQAKDRHYAQLGSSIRRMANAVGQTAELSEQLRVTLDAMKTLAANHAAQFMTVAAELNADAESEDGSSR